MNQKSKTTQKTLMCPMFVLEKTDFNPDFSTIKISFPCFVVVVFFKRQTTLFLEKKSCLSELFTEQSSSNLI